MPKQAALSGELYERLKRDIQGGRIKPGTRLVERAIAHQMAVSRTPVREALRRLAHEGLAEYRPHAGLVVAALSTQDIEEIYALREALESLAAREAAKRVSVEDLDALSAILREAEEASAEGDLKRIQALNNAYHERIVALSGMRILAGFVRQVHDRIQFYRSQSLSLPGRPQRTLEEHRLLLDTLRQNEPDLAEAAMRLHVRRARDAARQALQLRQEPHGEGRWLRDPS